LGKIGSGKEKIQKICDALKKQTIIPAKKQAEEIIENAKMEAKSILEDAKEQAANVKEKANRDIESLKKQAFAAIKLSCRQVVDELKQNIEKNFFNKNLKNLVVEGVGDSKVIASLIKTVIEAIEKEGIETDLSVYVSEKVKTEEINKCLAKDILEKLREKKVLEGDFSGGAKIKMHNMQITLDISGEAITSLVAEYIRKDFRDMIFGL
jgi:V/A-type H+-transporting ATPase subunit E